MIELEKDPNVVNDRQKFIGGSDLPAILGLNKKYGVTPEDFVKIKLGLEKRTFSKNEFTIYGDVLEPKIRDYINFKFYTKYKPDTKIDLNRMYRGNVDGFDKEAEYPLIEIKTFGSRLDKTYYSWQCQFYMDLFNVDKCLLVGYKRNDDFYWGLGEFDERYFDFSFDENRVEVHELKRDTEKLKRIQEEINNFRKLMKETKEEYNGIITRK